MLPGRAVAAADVARDVGLGAQLVHEIHEFVGAEVVVLDDAAPVGVDHRGALLARADAVLPVVLVGEAPARPAQHGCLDPPKRRDHVVADATGVRDRRLGPHPDAFVDAPAEVLGEVAVDVAVDHNAREISAQGRGRRRGDGWHRSL